MSERLEPGRLVRWQHDGGWKVGRVLYGCRPILWDDYIFVVKCSEGEYLVNSAEVEPHQTRKERGEE